MIKREKKRSVDSMAAERLIRKPVHFPAHVLAYDKLYNGYIINISAYGVGMFIDTDLPENTVNLKQGTLLTVEIEPEPERIITLQCIIRWLNQESLEESAATRIGMEVIDPPSAFVQLFDNS